MVLFYRFILIVLILACYSCQEGPRALKSESNVYYDSDIDSNYRLMIVADSVIDNFIPYPEFRVYNKNLSQEKVHYVQKFDQGNLGIELDSNGRLDVNNVFITDLNNDGIMEFLCKDVQSNGPFPPYTILSSTKQYDTFKILTLYTPIRFPIFYKKDKILSSTNGHHPGITTYYTYNADLDSLVETGARPKDTSAGAVQIFSEVK